MSQSSTNSSGLILPSDGPSPRPSFYVASVSTVEFMPQLFADIHAPVQPGNYPVVTLTYGGGYSALSRTQLSPLAEYLASRGVVAINADYQPLSKGRHLLALLHEVACIAAAAPLLAQPHLAYPAGPVWMLGFSAGALLVALATLSGDIIPQSCPHEPSQIVGMIGLGGPYEIKHVWNEIALATLLPEGADWLKQEEERLRAEFFARTVKRHVPENLWLFLDPLELAVNHDPRRFLLMAGGADEIAPSFHSQDFTDALVAAGHDVTLEVIPNAYHLALADPQVVGEAIVSFLAINSLIPKIS